jgi:teichoic acid transport system ATP-binding protein
MIVYGNKEAEIYDFGIFNSKEEFETMIDNDDEISVRIKARFFNTVECPTFSMTIKDFIGKEICGTNTNIEKIYTGRCEAGKEYQCEFKQKMKLAPGKYTLSLSCSKYNANGELIPINRNYDVLIFEVLSKKPIVGYYKLDTQIKFESIT